MFFFFFNFLFVKKKKKGFCKDKCTTRCSKAGVLDRCMKYCGICCEQCKCVPSGTYGNKHECPCYRDKRNKKGKPKCPWFNYYFTHVRIYSLWQRESVWLRYIYIYLYMYLCKRYVEELSAVSLVPVLLLNGMS